MSEVLKYRTLGYKVMAVAIKRVDGRDPDTKEVVYAWQALIKDVPGWCHKDEIQSVVDHGYKLPYDIATVLFPRISKLGLTYRG